MNFLLDVDGVIADFVGPFLKAASLVTGRDLKPEDADQWNLWDCFGLSKKENNAIYDDHVKVEGFCLNLPIVPGARNFVDALRSIADVWVVTSPASGRHWMHERVRWLWDNFEIPDKQVIFTHDKRRVHGDFILDDKFEHVRGWHEAWGSNGGKAILWSHPTNRYDNWFPKTDDYAAVLNIVREGRR